MKRFEQVSRMLRLGSLFCARLMPCCGIIAVLFVLTLTGAFAQTQQGETKGADPLAQPAISAILAAFDKYEVVAMPQGHGMQDLNDFVFLSDPQPGFFGKGERHRIRVRQFALSAHPGPPGPLHSGRGCSVHGSPEGMAQNGPASGGSFGIR